MGIFPLSGFDVILSVSLIRKSLFIHAQIISWCFSRYQELLSSSLETYVLFIVAKNKEHILSSEEGEFCQAKNSAV